MCEIFPQFCREVAFDNVRRSFLRRVLEGKSLLPWKLGRESSGEATGVAAMLALFPQSSLLLAKRLLEEAIHVTVRVVDEIGVDAVVHDEEESVLAAGLADEARGGGGVAAEVDERDVELRRVRVRAVGVGPHELGRDVGLVLQHRCVEDY